MGHKRGELSVQGQSNTRTQGHRPWGADFCRLSKKPKRYPKQISRANQIAPEVYLPRSRTSKSQSGGKLSLATRVAVAAFGVGVNNLSEAEKNPGRG